MSPWDIGTYVILAPLVFLLQYVSTSKCQRPTHLLWKLSLVCFLFVKGFSIQYSTYSSISVVRRAKFSFQTQFQFYGLQQGYVQHRLLPFSAAPPLPLGCLSLSLSLLSRGEEKTTSVTSKLDYAHNQILRYPFCKIRFLKREIRFYNSTLTFTAIVRLLPHFLHFNHVLNDETVESDFMLAKSDYTTLLRPSLLLSYVITDALKFVIK